jgi:3D-(3,5/4)-trihydroxycyclohexane-1,2-dione acylhydrolase (decyclizing)
LHKLWKNRNATDYHSEYAYSCMGYEIAGALGAKFAAPQREIYAFLGDGSYLMLNHEIVTSVQEGRKITVLLLNNFGYQCIHNLQRGSGSESFGNEFRMRDESKGRLVGEKLAVDFAANARSLGAKVFVAADEAELKAALENARKEKGTCLIYMETDPTIGVPGFSWWDVPVAEVSGQAKAQAARKNYDEKIKSWRYHY